MNDPGSWHRNVLALVGAMVVGSAALAQPGPTPPSGVDGASGRAPGAPTLAAVWPRRVTPPGHEGAMGVVRPVDAPEGLTGFQPGAFGVIQPSPADQQDGESVAGAAQVELEGPGSFLFRPLRPRPAAGRPTKRPVPTGNFRFVSGERGQPPEGQPNPVLVQRTWFSVYEPALNTEPRGLALVMPGLFNTPEPVIEHMVGTLRDHGWVVLRMMAQPSRFTERVTFKIDPERLDGAAGRIASIMQDRAAECAYAVQAGFEHILKTHAEYAPLPRVAIGMSGGGMTLPTVVALEPDRYAAAVIIAGGADFLTIAIESNYRFIVDAMTFDWPTPPTPAQLEALEKLYREKAPLDSLHTASALVGKPVLMIHGTHDGAVPAHLGDELWEALGKPERWSEEAGHEEVFMHLPQKASRICDWLAEKTTPKKAP